MRSSIDQVKWALHSLRLFEGSDDATKARKYEDGSKPKANPLFVKAKVKFPNLQDLKCYNKVCLKIAQAGKSARNLLVFAD